MTPLPLLLGCVLLWLVGRWGIRQDEQRRRRRAPEIVVTIRVDLSAFNEAIARVGASAEQFGILLAGMVEPIRQASDAIDALGMAMCRCSVDLIGSPVHGPVQGPGPEPGSDAHRVEALADEELAAWSDFVAGLQKKNRVER